MSMIQTRAPLRISLGGGGTDLPSYYREHGGFLIGAAINKFVYMMAHTVFQRRYRMKYSSFEEVEHPRDIKHPILREALCRHWDGEPLEIASLADVPAGTGLGSSGAYTVSLLKALALARHVSVTPESLAEDACEIEIDILGEPVGKQDQYVAAHGGICAYTFNPDDSVDVEPLQFSNNSLARLQKNFLLFFTGEARSASALLADQDKRTQKHDDAMVENLHRTKQMGYESRELLESGDFERYAELMHEHWENKRRRSPGMANPHIDELYELARGNGTIGGKLVGAGGGGFLLLYTERPDDLRSAMAEASAPELPFEFDFQGCTGSEYT
jgi:D-glycero-alpha-D-manno-heptose-7-phosphate kinase